MSKDFEDIFREEFENFTLKPSKKVWSDIDKQLSGPRLEYHYKEKFNNFKISPSEHVWRRIATAVWFNKFIHFTPFSFNIYYLGFIITAIVGTTIYFNNNEIKFLNFEKGRETVTESQLTNQTTTSSNEIIQNSVTEEFALNSQNQNIVIKNNSQISEFNYLKNNSANNLNSQHNKHLKSQELIRNDDENIQSNEFIDNNLQKIILNEKLNRIPDFLLKNKPIYLNYNLLKISDSIALNSFLNNYIKKDTIGYDFGGVPVIVEKSFFIINFWYNHLLKNDFYFKLNNPELSENYKNLKDNLKLSEKFYLGIDLEYNFKNFIFASGIAYRISENSINFSEEKLKIEQYSHFEYFDNSLWSYDTVWYLDLNEYINGNIVYLPHVDSVNYVVKDSILIHYYDTISSEMSFVGVTRFSYLEVPIIFGYKLSLSKFDFSPKVGLIGSMIKTSNYEFYDIYESKMLNINHFPLRRYGLDYYFSLNFRYNYNNKISLFVEPYLRGSYFGMFAKSYALDMRYLRYGLRTGLSYKF